ncbi:MAG TPA: alkaline phosphatase family protein [Gemmatimonadaceae bacterium]|nr:alkaline phosphatase family protein [Gemmatimonadaceae bacterium]
MRSPIDVRRVILVVLDGLRPDAIEQFDLRQLREIQRRGASTGTARTVAPSVTAAAMGSLLTGVPPERHGLVSDRFHIPRPTSPLRPMPRVLVESNYPASAFITRPPLLFRWIAGRLGRHLGFSRARFVGKDAAGVLAAAGATIASQRRGLILLHWPDADRAGHDHGWMTPEYGAAARKMDESLARLGRLIDAPDEDGTLLILLSDHGGGGTVPNQHDSAHPSDRTTFVTLAGRRVLPGALGDSISLLDVPATVLWALGVKAPDDYAGTPIRAAFRQAVELPPGARASWASVAARPDAPVTRELT